jgi:hypothetical protein
VHGGDVLGTLAAHQAPSGGSRVRLGGQQCAQARASALRDLAVLLEGPAELPAELGARDSGGLVGEHQSLVPREARRDLQQPLEVHPPRDQLVHFGAHVANLDFELAATAKWERILERGLQGAAPTQRSAAVSDPGEETLLERVSDVGAPGESPAAAHGGEQLERRLAKAFLEVLGAQLVAMGAQQNTPPGASD